MICVNATTVSPSQQLIQFNMYNSSFAFAFLFSEYLLFYIYFSPPNCYSIFWIHGDYVNVTAAPQPPIDSCLCVYTNDFLSSIAWQRKATTVGKKRKKNERKFVNQMEQSVDHKSSSYYFCTLIFFFTWSFRYYPAADETNCFFVYQPARYWIYIYIPSGIWNSNINPDIHPQRKVGSKVLAARKIRFFLAKSNIFFFGAFVLPHSSFTEYLPLFIANALHHWCWGSCEFFHLCATAIFCLLYSLYRYD